MKVGIVGAGMVGGAVANALVLRGIADEIVLVDLHKARALAEAQDVFHAAPFSHPANVYAGSYRDLKGSDVVVISGGVAQKTGETRLDLLKRNAAVFCDIIPQVMAYVRDPLFLIVTNPVDIMTQVTQRISGLPAGRVIGSGTILDTARFKALMGRHLHIDPHSVHAYVLGEHGDSEVLTWAGAIIGTVRDEEFCRQTKIKLTTAVKKTIDTHVRRAAYEIIQGKGATWYGVASGAARIIQAISHNEHAVLTTSILTPKVEGVGPVCVSLPRVIGAKGVVSTIIPYLDASEKKALKKSAQTIYMLYKQVEKGIPCCRSRRGACS